MAEVLVVFHDIKGWAVPLISRKGYLTAPKLDLNLQQKLPDDIEKKQKAILDKSYRAQFDKEFFSMSGAHFKEIQSLIDEIETGIEKSKKTLHLTQAQIDAQVLAANGKLKAKVDSWKPKVEALHDKCYEKALAVSDAEMKKKVKRAKIKVILVAVLVAALALTAIALTIATAGAGAALVAAIIAGVVATVAILVKFQGEFKTAWKLCQDKMAEIKAELDDCQKIFAELTKLTAAGGNSLVAKVEAMKSRVLLGSENIEKHVGQLEKFVHNFNGKLKAYRTKAAELKKQADDLKSQGKSGGEQQAQIAELTTLIDEMEKRIAAINEVRQSAAQITQRIKDNKIPDYPKLRKALDALGQVTAIVSSVSATVKSIVASVKKLKAA